ncbi:MAG TPA: ParB/RepB/Spo0J family partition protein [bacterium]|nr:ParB/RepB/Spo0J family partition protein [bacterium]
METLTTSIKSIPIAKIKPSADNPRHVIQPQAVETLMASMKGTGQQTPIKVRKLGIRNEELGINGQSKKTGEKAYSGTEVASSLTPAYSADTSRNDSDYDFELVGGHIRLEAAKRLGWETLTALVLDLTTEKAELAAILDNKGENMHWLDWDQAIEKRLAAPSEPTQQQVADELGVSQVTISRAKKITDLLTPAAREIIYSACINSGGDYELSEGAVRALTGLGDPMLVERALDEVIRKQMTEPQVVEMVEAVNKGELGVRNGELGIDDDRQKPEIPTSLTAPIGAAPRDDNQNADPYSNYWVNLPKQVKVTKVKKGYKVVMTLAPNEVVPVVYGAMSNWEHLKGLAGENQNLSYRAALPKVHEEAAKVRQLEIRNGEPKQQLGIRNEELGIDGKSKNSTQPGENAYSGTGSTSSPQAGVASSQTPAYSAGASRNDSGNCDVAKEPRNDNKSQANTQEPAMKRGFLARIEDMVQKKTGLTAEDIRQGVKSAVVKDAKQAANYEVRLKMRKFLKGLFN